MSIFDQKPIEQHVRELDEAIQNQLAMCYVGVTILETSDPEAVAKHLEKMVSSDYQVIGNEPEAEMLKKQQGRPVYRWDVKTFRKNDDADGTMYQLSKLPKEPKPIVIIENIADIPDGDRNIYDDPEHVENVLLHSWKNDTIHLAYKGVPFQMNKGDYTVIFPVKPGGLQKLRHSIKSDGFGFVQF